ncbi:MAG: DNA repair protein RecN [Pseudomonadota bacterium]
MLTSLVARDVVLIEHLCFEPGPGLTIITGETGAGKSVLIDSLGFVLGHRAETRMIRQGCARAQVGAEFIAPPPLIDHLKNLGIEVEDQLVVRRDMNRNGRSRAFINDQPVTIALLREMGRRLIDIHGQFASHRLLDPRYHRAMLDQGPMPEGPQRDHPSIQVARCWQDLAAARQAFLDCRAQQESLTADLERLAQAIDRLTALNPQPGEISRLEDQRHRLIHKVRIIGAADEARESLGEALEHLGRAQRALARIESYTDLETSMGEMDRQSEGMQTVLTALDHLAAETGEQSLEAVDDRLHALRQAARTYEVSEDGLPALAETLIAERDRLQVFDETLRESHRRWQTAKAAYMAAAEDLTAFRAARSAWLGQKMAEELKGLDLPDARFAATLVPLDEAEWSAAGVEAVRFDVSMNPGIDLAPLHKVASGGETARLFLALQLACGVGTSSAEAVASLVFDELDAGVSGATAAAVGRRLERLGEVRQTLAVTHSPQVAACGAHHWRLVKNRADYVIGIQAVTGEMRREEIARLLAGTHITDQARAAADQLLAAGG